MDDGRTKRGYALTGLMCIGSLACGPGGPSTDGGETTGYPLTDTASGTDGGTDGGTSDGTVTDTFPDTDSATDTDTDPSTGDPSDCSYRGDICGEMSVCQCNCDYSADCCGCESTTCTDDSHCPEGQVCNLWVYDHWTNSGCFEPECLTHISLVGPDADPSQYADNTCAWYVEVVDTTLTDLSALANLTQVIHDVSIINNDALVSIDGFVIESARVVRMSDNDALTDISALTSVTSVDYGEITCNGALDPVHIEDVLAQTPAGGWFSHVQNGAGPCP